MFVLKRDGKKEPVMFDKITAKVAMRVIEGLYDGVTTSELDNLAAETAATMTTAHPDYAKLAARIAVSNLHKNTKKSFSETMDDLYYYVNPRTEKKAPLLADEVYEIIKANAEKLDSTIIYNRDFNYDYFGFKTLERSYLLKLNGVIAERPQHMLMRVSIGIHKNDIDEAIATYELMSKKYFTHATPTLFNAGTPKPQMSSCFLLQMQDDSIEGIYDTLKQTAKISQSAGGIGLSLHNIRATGSYIAGTNGTSNGIVPMLKVFNDTARYVDQGGGKRKGSFAMYLEPWHADIFDFLDLKKNHGKEEMRARDLFYAMWVSDLFMARVQEDADWTLMCPHECPHLYDTYGEEFERLYTSYEAAGKGRKTIKAMLYKDAANRKSNQKNLGTIRSSNLCTEIMEYTAKDEVAVCNLASIALPMFISEKETGEKYFNHKKLYDVTKKVIRNLDTVIDANFYPVIEAENSNFRHRPVGMEIAKAKEPYSTFKGSPMSEGEFQYNMWGIKDDELSGNWDWAKLRKQVMKHGVRNSLLVAPMPTASTSQILGNNEAFEPYTSNIYTRRVLSGEFIVVNKHLLEDLVELGLWDNSMKEDIMRANGSIQHIEAIPAELRELYKTVWEMSMKDIIDMARQRGYFIDQSQSLNLFMKDPDYAKLTSMHFYAWKSGLKTGMYYLRTKSAVNAIQFTLSKEKKADAPDAPLSPEEFKAMVDAARENDAPDDCLMCGS